MASTKKPRFSKAEAREKLIAATIELMQTQPIGKVSALKICAHAGLDKMAVRYCFGSFAGLLTATAQQLGTSVSVHIRDGIFHESAAQDPNAILFGKLVAYLFTSLGDDLPDVDLETLPNFKLLETQITETYGIKSELARALAKRSALIAVATVAIDHFIPLTDREQAILTRSQRHYLHEMARVQDQILE